MKSPQEGKIKFIWLLWGQASTPKPSPRITTPSDFPLSGGLIKYSLRIIPFWIRISNFRTSRFKTDQEWISLWKPRPSLQELSSTITGPRSSSWILSLRPTPQPPRITRIRVFLRRMRTCSKETSGTDTFNQFKTTMRKQMWWRASIWMTTSICL